MKVFSILCTLNIMLNAMLLMIVKSYRDSAVSCA